MQDHLDKSCHQGRGITHARIRSVGVWIINGSSAVAHHITKCTCHVSTISGYERYTKDGRSPWRLSQRNSTFHLLCCWLLWPFPHQRSTMWTQAISVLFTCMSLCPIHLETATSLSTDSFLNTYQRFIGRRGSVGQLRSDPGTNFIGAHSELKSALAEKETRSGNTSL